MELDANATRNGRTVTESGASWSREQKALATISRGNDGNDHHENWKVRSKKNFKKMYVRKHFDTNRR